MNQPKRNDPCWCGSGKKYKKCHLASDERGETRPPEARARKQPTVRPGVLSPTRLVPAHIPKPEYAESGRRGGRSRDCKKTSEDEIARMRRAGAAARAVLDEVLAAVRPGITTDALDAIAHEATIRLGGYPSPLNYMGYPKSLCTSVNEVVVHGIPDSRPLEAGDIINCDVTVYLDGMHGDCSETVFVGEVSPEAERLVRVTWECLLKGIDVVKPGVKLNVVGRVIEAHAKAHGYSIVRDFTGHGIGELFHMDPYVAHYEERRNPWVIQEGMTFTIEPMLNMGTHRCEMWADDWTAVSADLSLSAQFEHTILVTKGGAEILTGGREPFFLKGR
ncbi:type I methionyl aminopeptidase [Myxococcota bacterium]|nr:type I methionyl aminopeptidase [Myxococcota bacterium]MBU1433091.1 type I methionyl aminopeptidase [Myxococcota bacterium]MBU1899182.1 type I methionyl aminopeptidase [Myxococcota bacterium]